MNPVDEERASSELLHWAPRLTDDNLLPRICQRNDECEDADAQRKERGRAAPEFRVRVRRGQKGSRICRTAELDSSDREPRIQSRLALRRPRLVEKQADDGAGKNKYRPREETECRKPAERPDVRLERVGQSIERAGVTQDRRDDRDGGRRCGK